MTSNNEPAFWTNANNSLIRYGSSFLPNIIERAQGVYLYDADGKRIIDFTSGQVVYIRIRVTSWLIELAKYR